MRKLLLPLLATAALALPAAAAAHGLHHHHHGVFAKVSGTGTSFAGNTATASGSITRSEKLGRPLADTATRLPGEEVASPLASARQRRPAGSTP